MLKESQKSGSWSTRVETRSTGRRPHGSLEDPKEGSGGCTGDARGAWGEPGEDVLSTLSSHGLDAKAMAKGQQIVYYYFFTFKKLW